jgi:phage-related protein
MILTNLSNVTLYTFPGEFDLHDWSDHDFSARVRLLERFGKAGASQVSDRQVESRRIKITGAIHAASQSDLKTALNNLKQALYNNGEEYRFSWETGYYIGVSHCSRFKVKRYSGGLAYKSVDIEIELVCPDPYWYSTTLSTVGPTSITTSPQDITFTLTSTVPTPLIIALAPSASWTSLTIKNVTDGNNTLKLQDAALVSGVTCVIDARAGSVVRDGAINTVHYFAGAFLRLLPGSNTIRYTGTTGGTITLSAPLRWL